VVLATPCETCGRLPAADCFYCAIKPDKYDYRTYDNSNYPAEDWFHRTRSWSAVKRGDNDAAAQHPNTLPRHPGPAAPTERKNE
jgi:hypothetical protein